MNIKNYFLILSFGLLISMQSSVDAISETTAITEANQITLNVIGAELFNKDGKYQVGKVLVGSPAFVAGLRPKSKNIKAVQAWTSDNLGSPMCFDASCIKQLFSNPSYKRIVFLNKRAVGVFGTRFGGENYRKINLDWFKSRRFGLPISQLPRVRDSNIWKKYLVFAAYGIMTSKSSNPVGLAEIQVDYVEKYSPAYFAGLKKNDLILSIDQTSVFSFDRIADLIFESLNGSEEIFTLYYIRNGLERKSLIALSNSIFPLKAAYFGTFDLANPAYVKKVSLLEEAAANSRQNMAMWNAFQGLAKSNGSINSTVAILSNAVRRDKEARNDAKKARDRRYALEGKICKKNASISFCFTTSEIVSTYLGRGLLLSNTVVTNHCPSVCAKYSGYCNTKTGEKYGSLEEAERENCRNATENELKPILKFKTN